MKTFKERCAQLERIYRLYLSGYGTAKLVEKAERFLNVPQVGMMF